jgi:hypothetical protein
MLGALALGALALAPSVSLAQTVDAPPQTGPATFEPPPSTPPSAPRSTSGEPGVQFVVFGGYDIGSTTLLSATMSDGSSQSIKANQGLTASVGIATLKLLDGKLATQATIGIEGWSINAQNGDAQWLAFPLDVMEFAYLDPVRLGAGISFLLAPSLKGSGLLSALDVEFKNSLGLAFEGDWVFRLRGARGPRATLGGRFVFQKLEASSGGPAINANSFAILFGYTG